MIEISKSNISDSKRNRENINFTPLSFKIILSFLALQVTIVGTRSDFRESWRQLSLQYGDLLPAASLPPHRSRDRKSEVPVV